MAKANQKANEDWKALPKNIQDGILELSKAKNFKESKLHKEFNEIIKYNSVKDFDSEEELINYSYAILLSRYQPKPKSEEESKIIEVLTPEIEAELKDPELLYNIVKEIQKEQVIDNEKPILVITNKIMMRLVSDVKPTSGNLLITDLYGGGKDIVAMNCCYVLMIPDDYYHRTYLSAKALNYWGTNKLEGWTWDGKVLYLEDPEDDLIKGQTFRVMSSGGTDTSTVVDQQLLDLMVDGKPIMIVTSFSSSIDREGERRWDGLRVDTTKELTKKVTGLMLDRFSGINNKIDINHNLRAGIQKHLKPYNVVFPDANLLAEFITTNLKARTSISNLIDYIKASAVLHQYQREIDDYGNLIATWFDYAYGKFVYDEVNKEDGIVLNLDEKEVVDALNEYGSSTIAELSNHITHSKQWIYNNLDNLSSRGIIVITNARDKERNNQFIQTIGLGKKVKTFQLPNYDEIKAIKEQLKSAHMGEIKEINTIKVIIKGNIKEIEKFDKIIKKFCFLSQNALKSLKSLNSPNGPSLNSTIMPLNSTDEVNWSL